MEFKKNLSIDFNNQFDAPQFSTEISNSELQSNFRGIVQSGDTIKFIFESPLTSTEEKVLDDLCGTHTPASPDINIHLCKTCTRSKLNGYQTADIPPANLENEGALIYDLTEKIIKFSNGTSWVAV